jgi:hypothetical protein
MSILKYFNRKARKGLRQAQANTKHAKEFVIGV